MPMNLSRSRARKFPVPFIYLSIEVNVNLTFVFVIHAFNEVGVFCSLLSLLDTLKRFSLGNVKRDVPSLFIFTCPRTYFIDAPHFKSDRVNQKLLFSLTQMWDIGFELADVYVQAPRHAFRR